METPETWSGLDLRGGFVLKSVRTVVEPMSDALDRPALARTTIVGMEFEIELRAGLSQVEISISLYHEVLEAATVAALRPPTAVCELNESGFEASAQKMHSELGTVSPMTLNRMLELFGF